jgi:hypothetical protein
MKKLELILLLLSLTIVASVRVDPNLAGRTDARAPTPMLHG